MRMDYEQYDEKTQTKRRISIRRVIDEETHEEYDGVIDRTEYNGDRSFDKSYADYDAVVEQLDNTEIRVAIYIKRHRKKKNNFIRFSQEEVAEKLGISKRSVERALKKLKELDYIRSDTRSNWMVNPRMLFYGKYGEAQMQAFATYASLKRK